jgi:hypothetical protein
MTKNRPQAGADAPRADRPAPHEQVGRPHQAFTAALARLVEDEGPTHAPRSDPTNPFAQESVGAWVRAERAREY